MARIVSVVVLVAVIAAIGVVFYRVMASFLLPLFLAAVLVVMFRPLQQWLVKRFSGRIRLAALCTCLAAVLVVLVPAGLVLAMAAAEASGLVVELNTKTLLRRASAIRTALGLESPYIHEVRYLRAGLEAALHRTSETASGESEMGLDNLLNAVASLDATVREQGQTDKAVYLEDVRKALQTARGQTPGSFPYRTAVEEASNSFRSFCLEIAGGGVRFQLLQLANPTEDEMRDQSGRLLAALAGRLKSVSGATGAFLFNFVLGLIVMVAGMYFFLADGPAMISTLMRLSPLEDAYEQELFAEFDRVSRAVVVATLLSAAAQGVLAGLGFWAVGVKSIFLWSSITAVFALIPFVGASAVWIPISLWLIFFEQRVLAGTLLAVYGAGVVSLADNLIKPLVLHGQSNLHPLLALLSVLGGVQALGPVGILIGPMVVVFLQTSLNILHRELTSWGPRASMFSPKPPLPFILSLRNRGLRLTYAAPRRVLASFVKERRV